MSWQHKVEARTLVTADQHRELWSAEDLEFVAAFRDTCTDEELAYALGRSYYAIASIKQTLDARLGAPRRVTERQRVAATRAYTFIDGDVPPGW